MRALSAAALLTGLCVLTHSNPLRAQSGPQNVTGEEYGTAESNRIVLGAADFRPRNSVTTWEFVANGYITRTGGGAQDSFWAPIHLPNGAQIRMICVYYYDITDLPNEGVSTRLVGYELSTGPSVAPAYQVLFSASLPNKQGYYMHCPYSPGANGPTLRTRDDFSGDGFPANVFYTLVVDLESLYSTRLAGATVYWRRQVSDPPSNATFGDVPKGSPRFAYVEALASAGVSAGCGGGKFCPDDPVTRGQLAVFLSKALGLHWPD